MSRTTTTKDVAEMFFSESEKHYLEVLRMAREKLQVSVSSSPESLNAREKCRTHEALGRVLLLIARHGIYNERIGDTEMQSLLRGASRALERATASSPEICSGKKPSCNSTVLYDKARIAALLGDGDECKARLLEAKFLGALPPQVVFRIEPDFSTVRDAQWFKDLGAQNSTLQVATTTGSPSSEEECYERLLKSLVVEGFSFKSTNDSLRFPLCELFVVLTPPFHTQKQTSLSLFFLPFP